MAFARAHNPLFTERLFPFVQSLAQQLSASYKGHYLLHEVIFAIYLIANIFSSYMYHVAGTQPAVILAPQGILVALALVYGYVVIPTAALATLIVATYSGTTFILALIASLGAIAQVSLTLYILNRFKISRTLNTAWDFYVYIAVAFFTSMIVPTLNVFSRNFYNANTPEPLAPLVWGNLWVAGLVSMLILAPFLVRLMCPSRLFERKEVIENAIALILLNIVTAVLTFTPYTTLYGLSLLIPFCVLLLWIALRGGTFFVTLAMVTVSVSAISGRILGNPSNPHGLDLPAQIVNAETSLIVFALLFYFIAALEEGRRSATDRLRNYTEGLEKTVSKNELDAAAKNEFIAMLGHELRNPLASILSSVELLKVADKAAIDQAEIINGVEERVHSMNRLLGDIFDISRITQKKIILKKECVSAREVLQRAAAAADRSISKNGHRFTCTLPRSHILIDADPVRMEQVIANLLNNATKFTPPGGSIEFASQFEEQSGVGTLVISVRDSGIGLNTDEQGRIFEPFTQINPTQSLTGGIGLGLTLARSLLDMHDGSIEVYSEGRGRGSEFIVRIPAMIGASREQQILPEATINQAEPGQSILVVDDNISAAEALGTLLRIHGYDVLIAMNGTEALQKSRAGKLKAVLLDIGLPDMDGYEVVRQLRAEGNRSMVIALSGYGPGFHGKDPADAGFDHYLTKPVSIKDIIKIFEPAA